MARPRSAVAGSPAVTTPADRAALTQNSHRVMVTPGWSPLRSGSLAPRAARRAELYTLYVYTRYLRRQGERVGIRGRSHLSPLVPKPRNELQRSSGQGPGAAERVLICPKKWGVHEPRTPQP